MQSNIIYKGRDYTACTLKGGLVVTINRNKGGVHLPAPYAAEWIEAIETAIDEGEKHLLCKAIIKQS